MLGDIGQWRALTVEVGAGVFEHEYSVWHRCISSEFIHGGHCFLPLFRIAPGRERCAAVAVKRQNGLPQLRVDGRRIATGQLLGELSEGLVSQAVLAWFGRM